MNDGNHQAGSKDGSVGCLLLGLFPFILVGSVFLAGSLEEGGNTAIGWLWIPFSILVMISFGIISYRTSPPKNPDGFSPPSMGKFVLVYILKQLLVLLVLLVIAFLVLQLPLFRVGF